MSIWEHSAFEDRITAVDFARAEKCIYCSMDLERDREDEKTAVDVEVQHHPFARGRSFSPSPPLAIIGVCPCCGWWKSSLMTSLRINGYTWICESKWGLLKRLDSLDDRTPLDEIRQYLMLNYDARFDVHPRRFEEVVGAVFKSLGFNVRVTAYSGDQGVDVILDSGDGQTIGVQVKRYRDNIDVHQIRELTGALVLGGHTKGVFVTTSDFSSGSQKVATLSSIRGYPIELLNARRFYDALKIAQVTSVGQTLQRKPWGVIGPYIDPRKDANKLEDCTSDED